jgi:hypothetical protein
VLEDGGNASQLSQPSWAASNSTTTGMDVKQVSIQIHSPCQFVAISGGL